MSIKNFKQFNESNIGEHFFEIEYPNDFKSQIEDNPDKTIEEHIQDYVNDLKTYIFEFDDNMIPRFFTSYTEWEGKKYKVELKPTSKIKIKDVDRQFYKAVVTKL